MPKISSYDKIKNVALELDGTVAALLSLQRALEGLDGRLVEQRVDLDDLLVLIRHVPYVVVDVRGGAVLEERLGVQVVVVVVAEAGVEPGVLVEEALVEQGLVGLLGGLRLPQRDLLRDVALLVPHGLGLVLARVLQSLLRLQFALAHVQDLLSLLIIRVLVVALVLDLLQHTLLVLARALRRLPHLVLLLDVLLVRQRLAHAVPFLDLLARLPLRQVVRVGHLSEFVVDRVRLQATAVRGDPILQRQRVPLRVLPVRDARWDLPV